MKKTYQNAKRLALLLLSFLLLSYVHGQIVVTGTVIDGEFGGGLPGANVVVKGTSTGTSTDIDGKYTIKVPDGNAVLVFSSIGFASQSFKVGDKKVIDLTLKKDVKQIEEVVKVGYGVQKKNDVTGSVSQIGGADISDRPVIGVDQAMQGKAAGVAVTANSGSPGADAMVRIRGTGSINSSDPLYVVDGVPTTDAPKINPSEIKSISVLKDASACAIYGSRAAGGVILITLKDAKMGGKRSADCPSTSTSEISFDAYYGIQTAQKLLPVTNATQYRSLYYKMPSNASPTNDWKEDTMQNTNWQKKVFRPAPIQRYTLAYETGSDNSSFRVSGSLVNQQGTIKGSDFQSANVGGRGNHKLKKWLTVSEAFGFSSEKKHVIDQSPNIYGSNPILLALIMDPTVSAGHDTTVGTYQGLSTTFNNGVFNKVKNPLRVIDLNNQTNKNNGYNGNFNIDIDPMKGLNIHSMISGYGYINQYTNYTPSYIQIPGTSFNNTDKPYYQQNTGRGWSYTWSNTATYTKNFMRKSDSTKVGHSISLMVGSETFYKKDEGLDITGYKMNSSLSSVYPHLSEADSLAASKYVIPSELAMQSYFFRINYAFQDRYLITINTRKDITSRFAPGKNIGYFPSFSFGWKLSEEDFFKNNENLKGINECKLRFGYGQIGNSNTMDLGGNTLNYPFTSTMQSQYRSYSFGGTRVNGESVDKLPNPNIKWETTTQYNGGLDLAILQNKVNMSIDGFYKKTFDMIVSVPLPLVAGGEFGDSYTRTPASTAQNVGSIVNKGIEASLSYKGEIAMKNKLTYELGGNVAYINNKVGYIGGGTIEPASLPSPMGFTPSRTQQGYSVASFYGYKVIGIYQSNADLNTSAKPIAGTQVGDLKFQDTNGDGKIDQKDMVYIGSPLPKLTYGLYLNGNIGNIDFNLSLQGTYGNKIFNATKFYLDGTSNGTAFNNNYSTRRLNAWSETNTGSSEPRLGSPSYDVPSSQYVESGSYLRLKDITIGYTFGSVMTKKLKINKLRIYAQIQNALTITKYSGYDPEVGQIGKSDGSASKNNTMIGVDLGSYPQARTFMGGVNFSF